MRTLNQHLGSALWYPGQSQTDFEEELWDAQKRQSIINAYLRGELETDSFLDWVALNFADPFKVLQHLPSPETL